MMDISIGPVLYSWDIKRLKNFYREILKKEIKRIYFGEITCIKRGFSRDEIMEIGEMVRERGKEFILSTPPLVKSAEEIEYLKMLLTLPYPVEVNSFAPLGMGIKKDWTAGVYLNIYNPYSASYLKKLGFKRIVLPFELKREDIVPVEGIDLEMYVYGILPLGISWRCYTLRVLGVRECLKQCFNYPDGIPLKGVDKRDMFIINGKCIMTHKNLSLLEHMDELRERGISTLRISPQSEKNEEIVDIFVGVIKGEININKAARLLDSLSDKALFNGWYLGRKAYEYYV